MSANSVNLQTVLSEAIEAHTNAVSTVARLQRELENAQRQLEATLAERRRVESLSRGTGQVFAAHLRFGSNSGAGNPEQAFAAARKSGQVPENAEILRFTDTGAAGQDPAHWSGWATAHYVIPA